MQFLRGVPILGLTATATSNVLRDVKEMLGIQAALTFRAGFNRANLSYEVYPKKSIEKECVDDIAKIIKERFAGESGIVYCLSRADCEKTAESLKWENSFSTKKVRSFRTHGIRAKHYHAYMEPHQRSDCHGKWISGKIQVIVATVAFGMGIDKPDVRFVIHHTLPKSIENYYQESGRAGRDGTQAACILFYRMLDIFKQSTMVQQERTGVANLYNMVRYASDTSTCRRVKLAEHFEEAWEPSWCQKQCDNCKKTSGVQKVDVSEEAKIVIGIIEENLSSAKEGSGKITGNKLNELLAKKLRGRSREFCEQLIVFLLLNSYIQEDFHYTVYSVISYVVVGSKWRVYNGRDAIQMTISNEDAGTGPGPGPAKSRKRKAKDDDDFIVLDDD